MEEQRRRTVSPGDDSDETIRAAPGTATGPAAEEAGSAGDTGAEAGDSFCFYASDGKKLDGTKSLSLEILAEVGLKSAGKGRVRIDYTSVLKDMLRTLGVFPICVMAFSIIGFLLYRFPANGSEWWIFQTLTMPSMLWLAIWRWFESWYVVDVAQRRLDYRMQFFGQSLDVTGLPREEIVGITLNGQMMVDGWQYCVVAGMKSGSLVRLSDFSADFAMMTRKAGVMARLLEVPLVDPRQEGYAELHPDFQSGALRLCQMPGQGPAFTGGGCILAFELMIVPSLAMAFSWPVGLLLLTGYFWSRYWWIR